MSNEKQPHKMILMWVDLETTGLDPAKDEVLEAAWGFTDFRDPFGVRTLRGVVARAPRSSWPGEIHPVVDEMHRKNGLAELCEDPRNASRADLWDAICREAQPYQGDDHELILAGSCPWFDRAFLERLGRQYERPLRLSHRLYDVSALKLFAQSLGMPKIPRGEAHRAVDDIRESIAHARICVEWLRGVAP